MKNIFLASRLLLFFLYSCNKNSTSENSEIIVNPSISVSDPCIENFYSTSTFDNKLIKIGEFHNEIMDIMTQSQYIQDKCDIVNMHPFK